MDSFIRLVGPNRAVEVFGVVLVGVSAENGKKLLFTLVFILVVYLLQRLVRRLAAAMLRDRGDERLFFWARQGIQLGAALLVVVGLLSIWFDDPTRLATGLGLMSAGLAFALQKVITAIAGYFIILRGRTFNVGERIRMGGVRGDVIALGFTQTTIMEMGQPPPVQGDEPAIWVKSRQYTGRVVTVSNATIFDEPVYNYTREFPYLWEELSVAVPYHADLARAESLLLDCARRHTVDLGRAGAEALEEMRRRYFAAAAEFEPRVYLRITENWLELTVRFVATDRGVRELKDSMSREIVREFQAAGIGFASSSLEIVGLPPLRLETGARAPRPD